MPINSRSLPRCNDCEREIDVNSYPISLDASYWRTWNLGTICNACYGDNYVSCQDCGGAVHNDNVMRDDDEDNYCPNCYSRREERVLFRDYDDSNESLVTDVDSGSIIKSSRPFGVEIEALMPTGEKKAKVSHELPRSIGVHEDGSIGGKGYGIEICTPPASGDKGENLLKEVCDIMARNGATVNKSCGLHVHLDVKEIDNRNANEMYRSVQRLWLFYLTFEDVLMSFLPPSRRSSNYCQSLKSDYHFREIAEAQNIDKLEKIWYRVSNQRDIVECKSESKHQTRYRGINMHTLFSERHIEIRFHSGTINFKKIAEWVNLHARIIDFAFNNNIDFEYMKKLSSSIDEGAKTREFFDMLKLSKGSRDYFLSRQEVFKGKLEKPLEAPQAIVSEITQLLANEVEA